jgi:DNA-binding NarL/FixJ family response regulator
VAAKGAILTEVERAILIQVARGATNQEIADHLSLTAANIKSQLHQACSKLKARNRIEAAILALKHRIISIRDVYTLDELAELLSSLGPDTVEAIARMLRHKLRQEQTVAADDLPKHAPERDALLSQGERDVLVLVGRGLSNREIADHLCTSTSTVRTFLYQACTKLSARNRAQAFVSAIKRQAIRVDEVFTLTEVAQFLAALGPDAVERIAQLMREKLEGEQASVRQYMEGRSQEMQSPLTRRERDAIVLVARGMTNREIAERLGTSASTVRTFMYQVCVKLEARNRAQAFITAVKRGAINIDEVFSPDELVELLAASGPEAVETIAQQMRQRSQEEPPPSALEPGKHNGTQPRSLLTQGERDAVLLVARGLTNQEIANRLQISPTTVRTLLYRASVKLAARNRIEAVFFALKRRAINVQEIFTLDELAELLESLGPDTVETIAQLLRTTPRQRRQPVSASQPRR